MIMYINKEDSYFHMDEMIDANKYRKILVVADQNTFSANEIGERVSVMFEKSGKVFETFVFGDNHLVPDERAAGSVIIAASSFGADFIVGIGSGTINDLCRYSAYILKINYSIIATAASMDGYLSTVSPLIVNGVKTTFAAVEAAAVYTEPKLLETAPEIMTAAGYGDIIGKHTSLLDWKLSALLHNETIIEEAAELTYKALEICGKQQNIAPTTIMDALVLSGKAMKLVGTSRPASGAEHHLAHMWEMMFLAEGKIPVLHGIKVGVAALAVIKAYEMLLEENIDEEIKDLIANNLPNYGEILKGLKTMGCPTSPVEIGISREQFADGFINAMNLRERFTILRFLKGLELIDNYAEVLADYFYGKNI